MKWDMAWKKVVPLLKLKIKLPTFGRKEAENGNCGRRKRVVVQYRPEKGD